MNGDWLAIAFGVAPFVMLCAGLAVVGYGAHRGNAMIALCGAATIITAIGLGIYLIKKATSG